MTDEQRLQSLVRAPSSPPSSRSSSRSSWNQGPRKSPLLELSRPPLSPRRLDDKSLLLKRLSSPRIRDARSDSSLSSVSTSLPSVQVSPTKHDRHHYGNYSNFGGRDRQEANSDATMLAAVQELLREIRTSQCQFEDYMKRLSVSVDAGTTEASPEVEEESVNESGNASVEATEKATVATAEQGNPWRQLTLLLLLLLLLLLVEILILLHDIPPTYSDSASTPWPI